MIIKAARSAENLPVKATATAASLSYAAEAGGGNNFRKESTVSLQGFSRFRFNTEIHISSLIMLTALLRKIPMVGRVYRRLCHFFHTNPKNQF